MRRGTDILVATPAASRPDSVRATAGDEHSRYDREADHLADLGFPAASKRLLDQTRRDGQRLLFPATLDGAVGVLVRKYLRDPATPRGRRVAPVPSMSHYMLTVRDADKQQVVLELVSAEPYTAFHPHQTRRQEIWLKQLTAAGIPAVDLHRATVAGRTSNCNLAVQYWSGSSSRPLTRCPWHPRR